MKRYGALFLAMLLLALTACGGGSGAATKGTASGQSTVAQLMENAAQNTPAEPPLPSSDVPPLPAPAEGGAAVSPTEVTAPEPPEQSRSADGVDVDLTQMSATMVFAEVSSIMYMPDDYVGKIIRMEGTAVSSTDPETGVVYHAVIIQDATACCASGLEYLLTEGEYPPDETEVTVTGEFELYAENGVLYGRLKDAALGA
ncbi:MAG: hypothetical protein E7474_04770 [Ruminococcaceae bacterium]|nr:hypothetical protein [Oscillospiraceae bacterium]